MKYLVKVAFYDLQDNNYRYERGDFYPREGLEPTDDRINELSTDANKRGQALITAVKSAAKEPVKDVEAVKDEKPAKTTKKSGAGKGKTKTS